MKKTICLLLSALLMSGTLLSCSSGGENADESPAGVNAEIDPGAPAPETAPEEEASSPAEEPPAEPENGQAETEEEST